ncbi:hypothetical protein KCP73_19345 [Salmonella enterica subsp. enterica]|nr:hypothetical protein KCP73_19345 [Salmonella enterica subsp. enterica]
MQADKVAKVLPLAQQKHLKQYQQTETAAFFCRYLMQRNDFTATHPVKYGLSAIPQVSASSCDAYDKEQNNVIYITF